MTEQDPRTGTRASSEPHTQTTGTTTGEAPSGPHTGPWHRFWRSGIGTASWRIGVGIVGTGLLIGGLALVPLPGPGWVIVFAGLAVLGIEYAWARATLGFGRRHVSRWSAWASAQPLWIRGILAGTGLLIGLAALLASMWLLGVPEWLPQPIAEPARNILNQNT